MSLSFVFSNSFIPLVECWQYIAYFMPCHVSVDLLYAVSPSSFPFPLLLFRFFKCRPCFPVLSVHCWQVTLFSFHFLIWPLPPPLIGCGLGVCRHLGSVTCDWSLAPFVTLHNQSHSPIHPWLKYAPNSPQLSLVTTLPWRTPDLVCPRGSLRTTKVAKQGPSANSPVKDLKDLSAMDAFRSRSISVSEHAVRR